VRGELEEFERVILPRLVTDDVLEWDDGPATVAEVAGTMTGWQQVARHLAAALPGPGAASPLNTEFLRRFLRIEGTSQHAVEGGRLHWRIGLLYPWGPDSGAAERALTLMHGRRILADDHWDTLMDEYPAFREWLMRVPPMEDGLPQLFTYLMPALATVHPGWAREALDVRAWRARILADHALAEEERARRVTYLDGYWFRNFVNNTLLYVLPALASDHFGEIAGYLDHRA